MTLRESPRAASRQDFVELGTGPWCTVIRVGSELVCVLHRFDDEFPARELAEEWNRAGADPRGKASHEYIEDKRPRR